MITLTIFLNWTVNTHLLFMAICFLVNDAMAFDGVDFDEPMEVGLEEEKPAVQEEAKPESKVATVKVEPKVEPQKNILL